MGKGESKEKRLVRQSLLKKVLSCALAVMLTVGLAPTTAFAAEGDVDAAVETETIVEEEATVEEAPDVDTVEPDADVQEEVTEAEDQEQPETEEPPASSEEVLPVTGAPNEDEPTFEDTPAMFSLDAGAGEPEALPEGRYEGEPILTDSEGNIVELAKIGLEEGTMFKWVAPGGNVYLATLPYGSHIGSLESHHKGWFDVFHKELDTRTGELFVDHNHLWSGNPIDYLDSSIFNSYRDTDRLLKDAQFLQGDYPYSELLADLSLSEQPSTEGVEGLVVSFMDETGFGANESWTLFIQIATEDPEPANGLEELRAHIMDYIDVYGVAKKADTTNNGRVKKVEPSTDPSYDYEVTCLDANPGAYLRFTLTKPLPEGIHAWATSWTYSKIKQEKTCKWNKAELTSDGVSLSAGMASDEIGNMVGQTEFFVVVGPTDFTPDKGLGASMNVNEADDIIIKFKYANQPSDPEINNFRCGIPGASSLITAPFDRDFKPEPSFDKNIYDYKIEVPAAYDVITFRMSTSPRLLVFKNDSSEPFIQSDVEKEPDSKTAAHNIEVQLSADDIVNGTCELTFQPCWEDSSYSEKKYTVKIRRTLEPIIVSQPRYSIYYTQDKDTEEQVIEVVANNGGLGELSYQWYRKTATGEEAIAGATDSRFAVPIADRGTSLLSESHEYFCRVTNTLNDGSMMVDTKVCKATTSPAPLAVTLLQADGEDLPEGGYELLVNKETEIACTPELMVEFDESRGSEGSFTYEWGYQKNGSFVATSGLTGKTAKIPSDAGTEYVRDYFVYVIYHGPNGETQRFASNRVAVAKVFDSPIPEVEITSQPLAYQKLTRGQLIEHSEDPQQWQRVGKPKELRIDAKAIGGKGKVELVYQWQRSLDGLTFEDISAECYHQDINGEKEIQPNLTYFVLRHDGVSAWYRCKVQGKATLDDGTVYLSDPAYSEVAQVEYVDSDQITFKGFGTSTDPYLLETADDLVELGRLVNICGFDMSTLHFAITSDITLPVGWTPIGTPFNKENSDDKKMGVKFAGTIDGRNHLLTIPEGEQGLLGYAGAATLRNLDIFGAKIIGSAVVSTYAVDYTITKNITIENVTLKSGSWTTASGFIGGYASGMNEVVIRNCTIESGVKIGTEGASAIGSFAGEFNGYIENCTSAADVYGNAKVGGLLGVKGQSMGYCSVLNSSFTGTVNATGNRVGGIVGSGYYSPDAPNSPCVSVRNCLVTGTISGADYVGGIFGGEMGVEDCWSNGTGYIQDNYFSGTIKATGSHVGGIIGYIAGIDRYNVIENNIYREGCGASAGIGGYKYIDTVNPDVDRSNPDITYICTKGRKPHEDYREDDPYGKDSAKLTRSTSQVDGSLVDALNGRTDGYGNWSQDGSSNPILTNTVFPVRLLFLDAYSHTLYVGDSYDLSGVRFKAVMSDGSIQIVDGKDFEVRGLDNLVIGSNLVQLWYKGCHLDSDLNYKSKTVTKFKVSFTLLGDSKHGNDGQTHTLAKGGLTPWVEETICDADSNMTVLDVFTKVCEENHLSFVNTTGNYIASITRDGVTLGEIDNGPNSGWMYTLNDVHSQLGVAEQYLKQGDVIVFHWTDDYTLETAIGGEPVDPPDVPVGPGVSPEVEKVYTDTATHLTSLDSSQITVASIGGEWLVLGLARSSADVPEGFFDAYLANVAQTLVDKGGVLHSVKYTEYSRVILGLTALGADVTDVEGYNLLEYLTDMDNVTWQGINGPIWALIAFDSGAYDIPAAPAGVKQSTREGLIDYILGKQLADSGWNLSGSGAADPDLTAMAIQALAPYYGKNAKVTAAVDKALQCLSAMQRADGGYASWGTVNAESCAQVVVALCALGIDSAADARFVKNGSSVLDALMSFAVEGGGFRHTASTGYNQMATEQGYYALAAYDRFKAGKKSLYDMTDVVGAEEPTPIDPVKPSPSVKPLDPVKPVDPIKPGQPTISGGTTIVGNTGTTGSTTKPTTPVEPQTPTKPSTTGASATPSGTSAGRLPVTLGGSTFSLGNRAFTMVAGAAGVRGGAGAAAGAAAAGAADGVTAAEARIADDAVPMAAGEQEVVATGRLINDDPVPLAGEALPQNEAPWLWLVLVIAGAGALALVLAAKRREDKQAA